MQRLRDSPHPPAVILGVTTNGLSFARSLGRRGIPVVMLETPAGHPGMTSRYGIPCPLPDILEQPEAWLAALDEIARQASEPVLIATGDEHILFVSRYRERLERHFRFRIPAPGLAELLCDKEAQYRRLLELECPLPKTAFVTGSPTDLIELAERTVGFPCLLKPSFSHCWRRRGTGVKLRLAPTADALRAALRDGAAAGEPFVLQEYIPGHDDTLHGYLACYGANGRPLAALTKRKLRQYPPGCGNGSLQVSTQNPEVTALSERILGRLDYQGLVAIEYKWDARDAGYKIMEINPRSVSGNQLAVDAGVDLPFVYYRGVLGLPIPPTPPARPDVRYLHLGWDVQAFLAENRAGRLSLLSWIHSVIGARSFALFDWRDPRPFLSYAWAALRGGRQRHSTRGGQAT